MVNRDPSEKSCHLNFSSACALHFRRGICDDTSDEVTARFKSCNQNATHTVSPELSRKIRQRICQKNRKRTKLYRWQRTRLIREHVCVWHLDLVSGHSRNLTPLQDETGKCFRFCNPEESMPVQICSQPETKICFNPRLCERVETAGRVSLRLVTDSHHLMKVSR